MPTSAIQQQLARLRGQLRRWVLVRGLARWVLIALIVLALDMFVDRVFKMDFAQRLVMLVLMAGSLAAYLFWRVLKPIAAQAGDDSLVYEVEAKHPELKESLLSGLQLSRSDNLAALGMSGQLVQATIDEGVRRAGSIHTFDTLNHFFLIAQMIVPGSSYWNLGIGRNKGEVEKDEEGIRTMEVLGRNMVWLLKKIQG